MSALKRRSMLDQSGAPTPNAVVRYTEGDCWLLAFELGKVLNVPLVALARADEPENWMHVVVDLGRETVLDVLGPRTRDESMDHWTREYRVGLVFRELGRFHSLQDMLRNLDDCRLDMMLSRQDEEDVTEVAAALAARYGTP